ncbi:hypothetical protein MKX03_024719 [Papaver bracteatum]|nr:hypothetical protein MKX03_024719 [Papaver bracteatum]
MTRRYWNINLEEIMEARVHFGHGTRKWNPRMAPYISAKRKASKGKQFLIVGTKNKEVDSVASDAIRARCHYVNKKWLGGMSTNWSTTETRLHKIRDLRAEQKKGRLSQEYTALRECVTLGIPTICLIDTNCDPDLADISIPSNDDAIASIRLILNKLVFAICEGHSSYIPNRGFQVHAQVLITSWVIIAILLGSAAIAIRNPQIIPTNEYGPWVPFIGTMFLFIFVSTWALLPRKIIQLPHGELSAPMNDINTTVALALLMSVAYFYAGLTKKGLGYFGKYIQPTPILLPINILEDFTKPLSLGFRLFRNILADELVVVVLVSLVPSVVPIPVMFLGLFTSEIQAFIFATLAAAYIGESMEGHH